MPFHDGRTYRLIDSVILTITAIQANVYSTNGPKDRTSGHDYHSFVDFVHPLKKHREVIVRRLDSA